MKTFRFPLFLSIFFLLVSSFAPRMGEAATFKKVMKQHESDFKRCQEEEKQRSQRAPSGRVNVRVVLDETGRVVETRATKNTTESRLLSECLVATVEGIPFGKQKKKRAVYVHTFRFKRQK